MNRWSRFSAVVIALFVQTSAGFAQEVLLVPETGPTHRFERHAEGVYFIVGTGSVFVQSNCLMVEGDDEVLIVDSHVTPSAAEFLLAAVAEVTDKPVRYLVNSHYHFDHAHGNQAFPEGVEIIGHEYTREKLSGDVLSELTYLSFTEGVPDQIAALKERIAAAESDSAKTRLESQLSILSAHHVALQETVPTPPNITLSERMSLFLGDREVQLLFLGRGHTGGDVVVYLPEERFVFTGDLMLPFLSYMGDGYVDEWPATLEKLKALEVDTIFPGHGPPMKGKEKIGQFQAYLGDLWERVKRAKAIGTSAAKAAEDLDMTDHRSSYPQLSGPGVDARAVERIYERLER